MMVDGTRQSRTPFQYRNCELLCDDVPLSSIAEACGTPCYVYSAAGIVARYREYEEAFGAIPHTVCYAVKANSNLSVLRLLATAGAGFDIVSAGELYRVLQAGGDAGKVVFSGIGKMPEEVDFALSCGIRIFNCESEAELTLIDTCARARKTVARIALRVNPDVDPETHPYISTGLRDHKFGIDIAEAERIYTAAVKMSGLRPEGVSCHIGSQMLDPAPALEAAAKVFALVERLREAGVPISHLDLGGGLGVAYKSDQSTPSISQFIENLSRRAAGLGLHLFVEPGRSIVGECGVLLTRVLLTKRAATKEFVIVDAAMNDLIRPALYAAHHEMLPVVQKDRDMRTVDIVGPVCESGDFLARERLIGALDQGDLIAILTTGAYGFALSSNYNSRLRAAEVLVEADSWRVIRKRETFEDLVRGE